MLVIVLYLLGLPGFRKFRGGGSSGNFRNLKVGGGGGVEEFSGSRWGWPLSNNDIFQGGSDPNDTMQHIQI